MKTLLQLRLKSHYRSAMLMAVDLSCVGISYCAALLLKMDHGMSFYFRFYFVPRYAAVLLIFGLCLRIFRVHASLWSYLGTQELMVMALSILTGTAFVILYLFFTSVQVLILSKVAMIAALLSISLMLNVRVFYRAVLMRSTRHADLSNALIIGAGDGGYLTLKEVQKNRSFGANVVGFVDDSRAGKMVAGKRVLGTTDDIARLVAKHGITKAFIAIPSASFETKRRIINLCQEAGLETKIMVKSDLLLVDSEQETYPIKPVSIADLLGRGEADLNISQISGYLEGRAILVTGAGGSIGSVLCRQIVPFRPRKLILFDMYENSMYELEQEIRRQILRGTVPAEMEIVCCVGSVRDPQTLALVFKEHAPDVIFHAAAHKHVPLMEVSPIEAVKNNVFGTLNIIEAALAHNADRLIMISTDKAVNPTSVMGASKRLAELIMQTRARAGTATKLAAVRFGNVLGSSGSVIPLFEKQIAEGGPVTVTHRDIERYFMTIPEAAQLVMQAGSFADAGEIFVLDMGAPVRILDLAEKMIRLSGLVPYEDVDIVEVGLRPGEKMYEELSLAEEEVYPTSVSAITLAKPVEFDASGVMSSLARLSSLIEDGAPASQIRDALFEAVMPVRD